MNDQERINALVEQGRFLMKARKALEYDAIDKDTIDILLEAYTSALLYPQG